MSTDLHDRTTQPSPDEGPDKEKPKPALSLTQVVGGALAAMTAAALGSRLSVAGTVVGAALASIVAAVAGAVYTSSLRRTSRHVTAVWGRVRPPAAAGTARTPDWSTDASEPTETAVLPPTGRPAGPDGPAPDAPAEPQPARRRVGWKPVVAAAVLMFAIAAVALTGIELATGHALSGGTGTTVGQVAERRSDPSPTATTSTSPSASASPTQSAEPSTSASATPSSEPTAAPSGSTSATPSGSATAAPSATPSGTQVSPSGATTP